MTVPRGVVDGIDQTVSASMRGAGSAVANGDIPQKGPLFLVALDLIPAPGGMGGANVRLEDDAGPPAPLPREIVNLLGLPEGASVAAAVKVIEHIENAGESDGAVSRDDIAAFLEARIDSLRDDMAAFLETRAKPPRNKP